MTSVIFTKYHILTLKKCLEIFKNITNTINIVINNGVLVLQSMNKIHTSFFFVKFMNLKYINYSDLCIYINSIYINLIISKLNNINDINIIFYEDKINIIQKSDFSSEYIIPLTTSDEEIPLSIDVIDVNGYKYFGFDSELIIEMTKKIECIGKSTLKISFDGNNIIYSAESEENIGLTCVIKYEINKQNDNNNDIILTINFNLVSEYLKLCNFFNMTIFSIKNDSPLMLEFINDEKDINIKCFIAPKLDD